MLFPRHLLQCSEPIPEEQHQLEEVCNALLNICHETTQHYDVHYKAFTRNLIDQCTASHHCHDSYLISLIEDTMNAARYGATKPMLEMCIEKLQPTDPDIRKKMLFITTVFCIRHQYPYRLIKAHLYALVKPFGHATLFHLY